MTAHGRAALALAAGVVALSGDVACAERGGFDEVRVALESEAHLQPTPIPMLGLARFIVRVARPDGVQDLQLAVFEHTPLDNLDGVAAIVGRNAGDSFRPVVQTWSKRKAEGSLIYARPEADDRVTLLVFAHDHSDTVFVRVVASVDKLVAAIEHPDRATDGLY